MMAIKIILIFTLISFSCGVTFDCLFVDFDLFPLAVKPYSCFVIEVKNPTEEILTAVIPKKTHQGSKTDSDVKVVQILECKNINFIPKKMQTIFVSLNGIHLDGCAITALKIDDLNDYGSLIYFGITGTNILSIPSEFFKSTPQITAINFSNNKIEKLSEDFLKNLLKISSLTWASFGLNECFKEDRVAVIKSQIPALIDDLRENCVSAVESTTKPNSAVLFGKEFSLLFLSILVLF